MAFTHLGMHESGTRHDDGAGSAACDHLATRRKRCTSDAIERLTLRTPILMEGRTEWDDILSSPPWSVKLDFVRNADGAHQMHDDTGQLIMVPRLVIPGQRPVARRRLSSVAGENGGRTRSDKLHALFLLFLIVIVCWQGCVVGAHFHGRTQSSAAATASAALAQRPPTDRRGPDPADNCPLCQEAAIAGTYIEPGPVVLLPPSAIIAWYHQVGSLLSIGGQRSHDWRSRAPPKISSPD